MFTVSESLHLSNPDLAETVPGKRRCLKCHRYGVHCYGKYYRLFPAELSIVGLAKAKVLVSRYWCIQGRHTFSILPRPLVRRLRIPLPLLVYLAMATKTWDTLEALFNVSRSTLSRWLQVARMLAAKLPVILAMPGITWMSLSQIISRLQYPMKTGNERPTLPGTAHCPGFS